MKLTKTTLQTLIISSVLVTSTFAMQDTAMTDTMMKDKMMDDKMATGTMMQDKMDNKMMMEKEDKMKMMMAITKTSPRSEVAKLQQHLIDEGYLKVRKGTKLGFYGPLTTAAYAKYMAKMKMTGDSMMKDIMMKSDTMKQ